MIPVSNHHTEQRLSRRLNPLVWLCCLLALFPAAPSVVAPGGSGWLFTLVLPGTPPVQTAEEDDDGDDDAEPPAPNPLLRALRKRCRETARGDHCARAKHLPHHPTNHAGLRLLPVTPFEQGAALLPLRC